MKAEYEGIHPDEGTIHAWLDDALDSGDASRIALHVESCAECADRVAEARGLIAGASRVVRLLDDEPAPMLAPATVPATPKPISRWLRVTPARAAIAATLIVAAGLTLTRDKVAVESAATFADSAMSMTSGPPSAPVADASAPQEAKAAAPDSVLASAISRRLREENPQRTIGGAAGVAIPSAPPSGVGAQAANMEAASRKVAAGRDSTRLSEIVVTASSADKVQALARDATTTSGPGCYRLESRDGGGSWAGIPLPAEIALATTSATVAEERAAGGARTFAITPVGGGAAIGSWTRFAGDSIAIELKSSFATTSGFVAGSALTGTLQARSEVPSRQAPAAGVAAAPVANTVRVNMRPISCPR